MLLDSDQFSIQLPFLTTNNQRQTLIQSTTLLHLFTIVLLRLQLLYTVTLMILFSIRANRTYVLTVLWAIITFKTKTNLRDQFSKRSTNSHFRCRKARTPLSSWKVWYIGVISLKYQNNHHPIISTVLLTYIRAVEDL